MRDGKIKIGVWNIYGPTQGEHSPASKRKIEAFQNEENPDIAFYLEAPKGSSVNPKWEEKYPWVCADNPRGILVVHQDGITQKITQVKEAEGMTAIGINLQHKEGDKEKNLRVIAVWTHPAEKSKSQQTYLDSLKNILQYYKKNRFIEPQIPCVVVGDTNVNLAAGAAGMNDDSEKTVTSRCKENLRQINSFKDEFGLMLYHDGISQNTLIKNSLWYRCDLMLISENLKIESAHLGKNYYSDNCKSDHRPIIFEISFP